MQSPYTHPARAGALAAVCLLANLTLAAQSVTSFTLVDAATNEDIGTLADGDVLDLATLPAELNVRANTNPAVVGSVRFGYRGDASYRVESASPYALAGDKSGDYYTWTPTLGTSTLSATPYSASGGKGTAGAGLAIAFEVVDGPAPTSFPPTNLQLAALSATELQLTWDPPADGSDYRIEFATSPDFADSVVDFLYYGYDEFVYDGLEPATTYYFRMRTSVRGDLSAWSDTVSATTLSEGGGGAPSAPGLSGELRQWHAVTLDFAGPRHAETDDAPNPFLDYRLDVTFAHAASGKRYVVPGYFAADGRAAESGASAGNVWRVRFTPDETGAWTYATSFRAGTDVAVAASATAGSSAGFMDGAAGGFEVLPSDKSGRDFRAKGRLSYVGEHYLRFEGTGEYFVKGGPDAPENFLAYEDFDNNPDNGGRRKSWAPHAGDYRAGDPSWRGGRGTEIVGALNYLASEGMNAFSFLTMNINGDDRNVYPYVTDTDFEHFDCSKLDQWDIVFAHAQTRGLYLHFKTQETENDQLLDGGELGPERKLYYRMLIARFGYHLALNWNLGEENTNTEQQRKAFAQFFADHDPYRHHVVLHTYPGQQESVYEPLLGSGSALTGASIQIGWNRVYDETKAWVERSRAAGRPWVVANDEQNSANVGVPPYVGYVDPATGEAFAGTSVTHDDIRRETLWGNLMAGGAGVEYYFGYQLPQSDLTAQDYRSRDGMWDYTRYALEFFGEGLPLAALRPDNGRATRGRVLGDGRTAFVVQLPSGGTADLTLPDGTFTLQWFDPRTGRFAGGATTLAGGGARSLGPPPSSPDADWVARVLLSGEADPTPSPQPRQTLAINAGGPAVTTADGTAYVADAYSTGGRTYASGVAVAGTTDDALYQTERYGGSFGYDIPVADGAYAVTLRFAEIYFDAADERVFDVRLEGQTVVDDLDLVATAGGASAYDVTYAVDVTDGVLDVDLVASVENAKISAILVAPVDGIAARTAAPADARAGLLGPAGAGATAVFPNPTGDVLYVTGVDATSITLRDAGGRVLQRFDGATPSLSLGEYAPGVYFVEVDTPRGRQSHRVVRE